jgi:hypothetical protein
MVTAEGAALVRPRLAGTSIMVVLPAPFGPITQRSSPHRSKVTLFQRLEAVETDRDVLHMRHRRAWRPALGGDAARPLLSLVAVVALISRALPLEEAIRRVANGVTRMKIRPSAYSQYSGRPGEEAFAGTRPAPITTPASVPRRPRPRWRSR